jgi:hypothetical protein
MLILKLTAVDGDVRYINMDQVIRVMPMANTGGSLIDFNNPDLWQEVKEDAASIAQKWAFGISDI